MNNPFRCSEECWTAVDCAVCLKRKAPRGRSVPTEVASGYCNPFCEGYDRPPKAPHLWPEEKPKGSTP